MFYAAQSGVEDMWSADKLDSYFAMTAHWIGHELGNAPQSGQLSMKAALITFHYLPSTSHMGEELAKTIFHLINCADIPVDKIGHFTIDNATNNDTAMAMFMQILQEESFVHNTLSMATSVQSFLAFQGPGAIDSSRVLHKKEYITVVQEDPIQHGWETVQCICISGQHWHNFQQTIESRNAN
ncbi:hypothetical protein EDD17DRAFT_1504918 [Pisolithus thermaeus]|nr:hypothetical protein EV401DRAFT_1895391 [Pisolithus croceorrhizus]KAI6166497.1 hypothetical protein EDD17DRAFT_1504918 [Pisolithus thermaeus]